MTDNEIVEALECCYELAPTDEVDCAWCPYCDYDAYMNCSEALAIDALDLINRQKAEIKRLGKEVDRLSETVLYDDGDIVDALIVDAVKEFAERLKNRNRVYCQNDNDLKEMNFAIDSLVREMVGDVL